MYAFKLNRKAYWTVTAVYIGFLTWLYLPTPIGYGRSILNPTCLEFLRISMILQRLAALFAGLTYLKIGKELANGESGIFISVPFMLCN